MWSFASTSRASKTLAPRFASFCVAHLPALLAPSTGHVQLSVTQQPPPLPTIGHQGRSNVRASWPVADHATSPSRRLRHLKVPLTPQAKLDAGVYTLHDLRTLCRKEDKHWCPYYLARHMLAFANVIVYNYQYMLDPKARRQTPMLDAVC